MKKLIALLGFVTLLVSAVSCNKNDDEFPPYYQVSRSFSYSVSTGSTTDFSNLFDIIDPYINKRVDRESQAIEMYNEILEKTKNVSWHANESSYLQLSISKYSVKSQTETSITYDIDPSYRSPKNHIWDSKGSRDL